MAAVDGARSPPATTSATYWLPAAAAADCTPVVAENKSLSWHVGNLPQAQHGKALISSGSSSTT